MENKEYFQIERILSILSEIDLDTFFPPLRGWAVSPDFLDEIIKTIIEIKDKKKNISILELGTGASTFFIASLIKNKNLNVEFISVDHDYDFLKKTERNLQLVSLDKFCKLVYAPLSYYVINEKEWLWYNIDNFKENLKNHIDILIIDGPPYTTQNLARYPAIPILKKYLSPDAIILLDDYFRDDEQLIVKKWLPILKNATLETLYTEKGAAKISLNNFQYNPLVSVCIPTFNRAHFLKDTLDSVIRQNYSNFEIVIVDDASTDKTESIVKVFKEKSKIPIKYFKNEKNMGRPFSRNRCISEASGEFILWLDDDDILEMDTISSYIKVLNEIEGLDILYGNLNKFGLEQGVIEAEDFYLNNKTFIRKLLKICVIPNPGTLVRKELYKTFGNYNLFFKRAQDYEFWTRIAKKSNLKHVGKVVVNYRIHDDNISYYHADTSYESVIKRKMLDIYSLEEIFNKDLKESYIFEEVSDVLSEINDIYNSILYAFHSYTLGNENSLKKAFMLSIIGDYTETARAIYKMIKKRKNIRREMKELELLYKSYQKGYIDYEYLKMKSFRKKYEEGIKFLKEDNLEEAYKELRTAFIMKPVDKKILYIFSKYFEIKELKEIEERILLSANKYEKNYFQEYKKILKLP